MTGTNLEAGTADISRHDPDFYIEDGNIILSAKDSEKNTLYFRLHKSTLAKHSTVFQDMFDVTPTPIQNKDQYDGVPLVEMLDDANALRELIALLYDPQCISTILEAKDFTLKLLGSTQLAKKYDVDWILKMVASQLQKHWPTTLEGWNSIEQENAEGTRRDFVVEEAWIPAWEDRTLRLRQFPEPVSSIRLADECDVPSILPFAWLHLLRCQFEPDDHDYLDGSRVAQRTLLSLHECHRLMLARERIGKWFAGYRVFNRIWNDCGSGLKCEATALRIWLEIATRAARDGNILEYSGWRRSSWELMMCPGCQATLQKEVDTLMQDFVSLLSHFFELEDTM